MKKAFDEYKQKVAQEFERVYLSPQFGEGTIKKNLLEGLVSTLDNFSVVEKKESVDYPNLEEPFNYSKICHIARETGHGSCSKRVKNFLEIQEIKKPSDLIKSLFLYGRDKYDNNWRMNDGKILYRNALLKYNNFGDNSIGILVDYLESEGFDFSKEYAERVKDSLDQTKKLLNLSISATGLDLSPRLVNTLKNKGIEYFGELIQKSEAELKQMKGIGKDAMRQIKNRAEDFNLKLGTNFNYRKSR